MARTPFAKTVEVPIGVNVKLVTRAMALTAKVSTTIIIIYDVALIFILVLKSPGTNYKCVKRYETQI